MARKQNSNSNKNRPLQKEIRRNIPQKHKPNDEHRRRLRAIIQNRKVYTTSEDPTQYYGEKITKQNSTYLREWDPYKSKIAAAMLKGLRIPINNNTTVLYLGSSTGTTVSHISDIAKKVYAVDISREAIVQMMKLVYNRKNIIPILADATTPPKTSNIDIIIQDISSRSQTQIIINNKRPNTQVLMALKTQSIDSTRKPSEIMEEQKKTLKQHFTIKQTINLEPYHKHHWLFYMTALK